MLGFWSSRDGSGRGELEQQPSNCRLASSGRLAWGVGGGGALWLAALAGWRGGLASCACVYASMAVMDRQTEKQTGRQTDRQKERYRVVIVF